MQSCRVHDRYTSGDPETALPTKGLISIVLPATEAPIQLGNQIIDGFSLNPRRGVCINRVICIQSSDARWSTIFPDSEGADPPF